MTPYASDWLDHGFCYISDTRPLGGRYHGEPRPFVGSVDLLSFDTSEFLEIAALANAVCRYMARDFTHSIGVAAMCNQTIDHLILCEICIQLVIRLDGIIDFDRLTAPKDSGLRRCVWTYDDQEQWTTLGTADEARLWMLHPSFHMLK